MTLVPRLWHFRVSHYNEKVRWALDYKSWPHERRALVPGFHIPRVWQLSGQTQVPTIRIDGKIMHGSNHILEEIERLRPEPPLFPDGPEDRARALAIQTYFDDEAAPDFRRLFWSAYFDRPADCARMATDGCGAAMHIAYRTCWPLMKPMFSKNLGMAPARLEAAAARLSKHLDRLEAEIRPSGYLVGDRFTIADLTAAAVLTALLRPPQFPYPLPEPWPRALTELKASIAERDGAVWAIEIYARHRGTSFAIGE